ncbi:MAG: hypothetical protein EBU15_08415 [Betaproteobacteria bacterium]|nr:hypothetical protein [Betaproteobacteria bacterium]
MTLTFGLWPADVSHREGIGRRYGLCRCNFDAPVAPGEVKGGARMNENADGIESNGRHVFADLPQFIGKCRHCDKLACTMALASLAFLKRDKVA